MSDPPSANDASASDVLSACNSAPDGLPVSSVLPDSRNRRHRLREDVRLPGQSEQGIHVSQTTYHPACAAAAGFSGACAWFLAGIRVASSGTHAQPPHAARDCYQYSVSRSVSSTAGTAAELGE